ncbi:hypothetical protein GGR50DRAFT_678316 [Xylaria sp. CBS 124048]|nr:hypothetical protein GGR50DRAFT_678316 [Xylaria sp. CBS 124048]
MRIPKVYWCIVLISHTAIDACIAREARGKEILDDRMCAHHYSDRILELCNMALMRCIQSHSIKQRKSDPIVTMNSSHLVLPPLKQFPRLPRRILDR